MVPNKYLIYCIFSLAINNVYCQRKSFLKFSTKTPYRFIENNKVYDVKYPGCEQQKIWMLIRHGTSLPKEVMIDFMVNKLPFLRDIILDNHSSSKGILSTAELFELNQWSPNVTIDDEEYSLTLEGKREMYELARRTSQRFGKILDVNGDRLKFTTTSSEPTIESAESFVEGIFGENEIRKSPAVKIDADDKLLNFDQLCEGWMKNIKEEARTYHELNKYTKWVDVMKVLSSISYKMGVSDSLAYYFVKWIFDTCAYETAWNLKSSVSAWCGLFTNSCLNTLEYADDLEHYWRDGYGINLNRHLSCGLFNNLIDFYKSNDSASFQFTNAGPFLKMLTFLGLYEPMMDLNYDNRDANRPWQTSRISPFAANLAFVFYRCGDEDKFLVMHQERPIHLPECGSDEDLCSLDVLFKKNKAVPCDIAGMCSLNRRY